MPEVAAALRMLRSRQTMVALRVEGIQESAAALQVVLDQVTDERTRVVWVSNPLRSPLTIDRFFLQAAGPEADLRGEPDLIVLARLLARRTGREERTLVIIRQPETMDAETRDTVALIGRELAGGQMGVQLLFVAGPNFVLPISPSTPTIAEEPKPEPAVIDQPVLPPRLRRLPLLPTVALAAFVTGIALGGAVPVYPALGALADTIATLLPAGRDRVIALQQDFDRFLDRRSASLPPLSRAQRDALFEEFQKRRQP